MENSSQNYTPPTTNTNEQSRRLAQVSPRNIGIFLVVMIMLVIGVFYGISQTRNQSSDTPDDQNMNNAIVNIAPYTVVYGSWTTNNSMIFAYDLSTGKEGVLAQLPTNIKKVSVIDDTTLLYIAQTNVKDYGRTITRYDIATKQETVLFQASEGFGIDDYVISPDKTRIALWEVQVDAESGVLMNGKSRVYTAALSQPTKNLIADETVTETIPVRYPRGILNNGTVFMDRFLPNSGAGWAYGMSVSNFTGTDQKDIAPMPNGSYGTQPVLSPDGAYLAFAGYDGSNGPGTNVIDDVRRSITENNTVSLLDTASLNRVDLPAFEPSKYYSGIRWGENPDELRVSVASPEVGESGYVTYSLTQEKIITKVNSSTEMYFPINQLSNQLSLVGKFSTLESAKANLGNEYALSLSNLAVQNSTDNSITEIPVYSELIQYITTVPSDSIRSTLDSIPAVSKDRNKLQLSTFVIKTELPEVREEQQSRPRQPRQVPTTQPNDNTPPPPPPPSSNSKACRDVYADLVMSACGAEPPKPPANASGDEQKAQYEKRSAWNACLDSVLGPYYGGDTCSGSPLYLYGPVGTHVDVTIHTPIFNSNVPSRTGSFAFILGENNTLLQNGKSFNSLSYDYMPAVRKMPIPTQGYLVTKQTAEPIVRKISEQFGFNERETNDTVRDITKNITTEYAFISFYDHETSHAILPITFNPKPDVYRNIVFYIKNLDQKPNYSVQAPKIEKINRYGFTAIEISHFVE